jgi:peptide deformylase
MANLKWGIVMRNIIKYVGIALVIVGILLVMKNLFAKDTNWDDEKDKNAVVYYNAKIKLLDEETKEYLEGARLVLKDDNGKVVAKWITDKKVRIVSGLENGKYTLSQESTLKNYHLNDDGIIFEINNADKDVVMYNTKMTEEEIRDANTTKTEVGVDNTASSKSILTVIIAAIMTGLGLNLIYKVKKNY